MNDVLCLCNKYASREGVSGAILGAMSRHRPACSARLTSVAVHGTQRSSTSLEIGT